MNNNTVEQISYYFILTLLSIILILLTISLIISCRRKQPETHLETQSETRLENPSARVYNFTDITTATDGFNPQRIISSGNTSTVYAGVSTQNGGVLIAVKRIHPQLVLRNASLGFSATIKTLFSSSSSSASHRNVVGLLGYCQAPGERIVVMEFAGTVSLEYLLHGCEELLDWNRRLKIAAGVARGIEWLHEKMGSGSGIVHGCFKSSKVLLDKELSPKICDYGLWFLKTNNEPGGGGCGGYVDEEYWKSGPSKESDVYGFGVVLLELMTGRRGAELVKWAVPLMKESMFSAILDPRLAVRASDVNVIVRLCKVASACVSNCRMSRPTIVQVASILNCLERDSS
ncbi:Serine/threonine-protein kinase-like protein ACR4 [Linum grandiflorum]